jgi:hypothetical protein
MPKPRPRVPTRVIAPGVGVSVRTRLRLDPGDRALLAAVGAHLTQARNSDLDAARRGAKGNDRYKVLVERFRDEGGEGAALAPPRWTATRPRNAGAEIGGHPTVGVRVR